VQIDRRPSIFNFLLVGVLLAVLGGGERASAQCPGDVISSGNVDGVDLSAVLGAWGSDGSGAYSTDVNGNGLVEGGDLAIILGAWGACPPVVGSVAPNVGTIVGGTPITISGNYFLGTTSVTIGGLAATGVQIVSATTINAITPAGAAGSAAVSVTANGRTGSLAGGYSYSNSSISSVVPSAGAAQGGGTVTISGAFLQNTTAVWFGNSPALSFTQVSPTVVSAVPPPGAVGTSVDVRLQTPAGLLVASGAFSYVGVVIPAWATLLEAQPDPSVVTDTNLRAVIVATGLAWRVKDTATQIEMVLIPPGTFDMGCSVSQQWGCYGYENPVHQVTLTNAFYMGRYEVTQAQWQARMGSNPSYFQSASAEVPQAQVPQRPVETVSWNTIQGFLGQTGMRLPTEAEWEFAYRAGTTTAFHGYTGQLSGTNDDNLLGNIAWFSSNSNSQTRPVGGKLGNGFGLHDMSGNVWEWVIDWYGSNYYSTSPSVNPQGPSSGTYRVLRGGYWGSGSVDCRASNRSGGSPGYYVYRFGFRVARTP